jgi:hypothetical protein
MQVAEREARHGHFIPPDSFGGRSHALLLEAARNKTQGCNDDAAIQGILSTGAGDQWPVPEMCLSTSFRAEENVLLANMLGRLLVFPS